MRYKIEKINLSISFFSDHSFKLNGSELGSNPIDPAFERYTCLGTNPEHVKFNLTSTHSTLMIWNSLMMIWPPDGRKLFVDMPYFSISTSPFYLIWKGHLKIASFIFIQPLYNYPYYCVFFLQSSFSLLTVQRKTQKQ